MAKNIKNIKRNSIYSLIVSFIGAFLTLSAQPPSADPNWQLNTLKSDEFNGTSLDLSKWHAINVYNGDCCNWGGNSLFVPSNVSVNGGTLIFKTDAPTGSPPYTYLNCCNTGGVTSIGNDYSYGYLEMRAKLPGYYETGGIPNGQKFQPTFWTYFQQASGSCLVIHDEIDIIEPDGYQYADGSTNVCGWHTEAGLCSAYKVGQGTVTSSTPLFASYHKYAVEWSSNRILFYFDDIPFYEKTNDPSLIMNFQKLVMASQIFGSPGCVFGSNITFPQYYNVDYFRYYTLNKDCSSNVVLLNNTDVSNFVYSTKSSITFGNGSNSISFNSNDNKYFRAVNSITVNSEFSVPLGGQVALIPTNCD